jgi:hypothetical protein
MSLIDKDIKLDLQDLWYASLKNLFGFFHLVVRMNRRIHLAQKLTKLSKESPFSKETMIAW